MKLAIALSSLISFVGVSLGQEGAPAQNPDPVAAARAAYQAVLEQRKKGNEDLAGYRERVSAAKGPEREALIKEMDAAVRRAKSPMDPFVEVFAGCDWTKFDPKTESELLDNGLAGVARGKDLQKAIAAGRMSLELFPKGRFARGIRGRSIPMALFRLGDLKGAVAQLRTAVDPAEPHEKASLLLFLGDLQALDGDLDGAKATYAQIAATGRRAETDLARSRVQVLGKPATGVAATTWIGGDAIDVTKTEGKIALIGFWASWAPSARGETVVWNTMRDELLDKGLVCVGVTKTYGHGYLPADASQIDLGGKGIQGMKPEEYVEHVKSYHTNMQLHYPVAIVPETTFTDYAVLPVPSTILVGRDGKVALVSMPSDSEFVRIATNHLLAKK